jgi:hypothetical protein
VNRYAFLVLAACTSSGEGGGPPTLGTAAKTWQYLPIDGTTCMDGSPTGIGVNLGTSGDLVIYLEGGGACFNNDTCQYAAHPDGWGPADFDMNIATYTIGLFDRTDDKNPLRDATFVFVPYCTGDVHAGSNPHGMGGRAFVGYDNVGADLSYVVPKAKDVKRVVLVGSSAGGFGALVNYERTQTAFGTTPVLLLDDSGPPLEDSVMTPCLQKMFRSSWNLDAALPAGCTSCSGSDGGGFENAMPWLADAHPDRRLALVTSTRDGTIRSFYGFGYPDCVAGASDPLMPEDVYAGGVAQLRDQELATHPNFRVYSKDSVDHVWLLYELETTVPRSDGTGTHLSDWLTDMLDPSSTWDSVAP